jgi:hypothetical protein
MTKDYKFRLDCLVIELMKNSLIMGILQTSAFSSSTCNCGLQRLFKDWSKDLNMFHSNLTFFLLKGLHLITKRYVCCCIL